MENYYLLTGVLLYHFGTNFLKLNVLRGEKFMNINYKVNFGGYLSFRVEKAVTGKELYLYIFHQSL